MDKAMILKLLGVLGGRKFIVTILTGLIVGFVPGITPEIATTLAGLAAAYILGQAYVDASPNDNSSTANAINK